MKAAKRFSLTHLILSLVLIWALFASAQEQFPWPMQPFHSSHLITGNFCEYRSTTNPAHFHNGTDIPNADGSPVYPVKNGQVTAMGSDWVRVNDIAYVHIDPNPALSIGSPVTALQTVLGTIKSGLGHVHFTYGYVGSEKNAMLPNSGLTPLVDDWAPIIRFVKFYQNNTTNEFLGNEVSGYVDIIAKVDEQNGPPGSTTAALNNGTYKIGYKILSADTSTVVYEPPNGGLRFQFDTKPSNSYVDIVYFKMMSSTTSHTYQVTNDIWRDNYWDTTTLPHGDYVVMVFTEDTRYNTDTAYVRVTVKEVDTTPPAKPEFKILAGTDTTMQLSWFPNSEADLLGYRLFFSFDNVSWSLFKDETYLTPSVTDTVLKQALNRDVYFRLTAVDNSPLKNESEESDVYGLTSGAAFEQKLLLVNGFHRRDGGWTRPSHPFVFTYGQAITANHFGFDSAPDRSIRDGAVNLNDYDVVFWFVGDESTREGTFDSTEQALIKQFLENGGRLLISGSHIAWVLDPDGAGTASAADEQFLHEYLKADYLGNDPGGTSLIGMSGSIFDGLNLSYGAAAYPVDSCDVIQPYGTGTVICFKYDDTNFAGVQYAGTFGAGTNHGKLVYLAFPFETIADEQVRNELMNRVLNFFFDATPIEHGSEPANALVKDFALLPAYPNPFNPGTTIEFHLPEAARVQVDIFNSLGQKVRTLIRGHQPAGKHQTTWDGRNDAGVNVPSGVYVIRLSARAEQSGQWYRKAQKIVLLK